MSTIITNVAVVTMNETHEVIQHGFAAWKGGEITAVGTMDMLEAMIAEERDDETDDETGESLRLIDGKGGILMPGMVNLHAHMGMIPFRGLGDDCKDRLRVFLLPMEQRAMDAELVYLSTKYAAAEMLLAGVTTVFDMYYFEAEAARAMDEMGIRGIAGETIMEEEACDFKDPYEVLSYGESLMKKYKGHPRISACVAPHGTTTCSAGLLKAAWKLDDAFGAPFSLHTAEMDYEMETFRKERNQTPIEYLESIGLLSPHLVAAHCIHVNDQDLALMAKYGCRIAHCIGSNMKAGKGIAPLKKMVAHPLTDRGLDAFMKDWEKVQNA